MINDEMPEAGGLPDNKISKYMRELIGDLPDTWRVHYVGVTPNGVKVKGALARASIQNPRGWSTIRPYKMTKQAIISPQKYTELMG
jgi:uncharacterized protein (DUF2461 family)